MRAVWYVERIAQKGTSPHWQAERKDLNEVFEDLRVAKEAGEHFRFIAPTHASDHELNALLKKGAMPTFPPRLVLPGPESRPAEDQLEPSEEDGVVEAAIVAKAEPAPALVG
ncbi:MAG TPA: hypothetical protein VKS78_12220 [Roseiarcus sp.]|nr:hypothetical protein [Roseiarcus sp.]